MHEETDNGLLNLKNLNSRCGYTHLHPLTFLYFCSTKIVLRFHLKKVRRLEENNMLQKRRGGKARLPFFHFLETLLSFFNVCLDDEQKQKEKCCVKTIAPRRAAVTARIFMIFNVFFFSFSRGLEPRQQGGALWRFVQ